MACCADLRACACFTSPSRYRQLLAISIVSFNALGEVWLAAHQPLLCSMLKVRLVLSCIFSLLCRCSLALLSTFHWRELEPGWESISLAARARAHVCRGALPYVAIAIVRFGIELELQIAQISNPNHTHPWLIQG
jgi:hypothetical protein